MKLEVITEADFGQLLELIKEFAEFEGHPELMTNSVEQMRAEKDLFQGLAVKDDNGSIMGYVIFFFAYYTWGGKTLYMDDLYVCEAHRGKGIGTMLIKGVFEFSKAVNCKRVRWQVSDWNKRAVEFYESFGAKINKTEMNCDLVVK